MMNPEDFKRGQSPVLTPKMQRAIIQTLKESTAFPPHSSEHARLVKTGEKIILNSILEQDVNTLSDLKAQFGGLDPFEHQNKIAFMELMNENAPAEPVRQSLSNSKPQAKPLFDMETHSGLMGKLMGNLNEAFEKLEKDAAIGARIS